MTDVTSRLALPLLHIAQAQKEMAHNEALTLIDLLLHGSVEGVAEATPPTDAAPGQCWIVGADPQGDWRGKAGQVAGRTAGGWRFCPPREGMALWWNGGETTARFRRGSWRVGELRGTRLLIGETPVVGPQQAGIAGPDGGNVVDAEARAVLGQVLAALRTHGLIAE